MSTGILRNKEIVTEFMRSFSEARLDEAFEFLAEEASWSLWGNGPGSGSYSKEAMRALLLKSWEWFAGPVQWIPTEMVAEDDRVAVQARSSATTHGGYHHVGQYHNLFRLRGGRIVEIQEMFLEAPVQALFKALQAEAGTDIMPPNRR